MPKWRRQGDLNCPSADYGSGFSGLRDEALDTAVANAILDREDLLRYASAIREDDRLTLFSCEPPIERTRRHRWRIVGDRIAVETRLP